MTKVKIHFYAAECKDKLTKAEATAKRLQLIHDAIISLGAVDLDIKEIRNVVDSDSSHQAATSIRKAILKDKKLEISGLKIDLSMIVLPEQRIATLVLEARKVDAGRHIAWHHFAVEAGKVVLTESGKQEIEESFIVYGSPKSKKIISEVEEFADKANAILKQIAPHRHSPLSIPESWLTWNPDTQKYEANFLKLSGSIE